MSCGARLWCGLTSLLLFTSSISVADSRTMTTLARDLAVVESARASARQGPHGSEVTAGAMRERAARLLRTEALLESRWGVVLTKDVQQAELDRMARESAAPDLLRRMFDALDRDSTRIAAAIVRPALVPRLVWDRYTREGGTPDGWAAFIQRALDEAPGLPSGSRQGDSLLRLPPLTEAPPAAEAAGTDCRHVGWRSGGLLSHIATDGPQAWTGSELLIWTGTIPWLYDPATDGWRTGSTVNAPATGRRPVAAWTGTEFVVYGGVDDAYGLLAAGGRYNPQTDSWHLMSTTPGGLHRAEAVWTGAQVVVVGGSRFQIGTSSDECGHEYSVANAWAYAPSTDTWESLPISGANRWGHQITWTGSEVLFWGGWEQSAVVGGGYVSTPLDTGTAYNPASRSSRTLPASGLDARELHRAAWTGTEWLVWGGWSGSGPTGDGARYNPQANTWAPMSAIGAPAPRAGHVALWSGSEMLVFGGGAEGAARYRPATDSWLPISGAAPATLAPVVYGAWTGTEAVVLHPLARAGGRYAPSTDSWSTLRPAGTPPMTARTGAAIVFTGAELLVWSGATGPHPGAALLTDGFRFDTSTAAWIPLPAPGAPVPRQDAAAVWSGAEMIVWGGRGAAGHLADGARFDPVLDVWTPIAPGGPLTNSRLAVWAGTELVVWNGTGARYNPALNTWSPIATAGAPGPFAMDFTLTWTGERMLAWGDAVGCGFNPLPNRGALYDPATDAWSAPIAEAMSRSAGHGSAWSGTRLFAYGGRLLNTDETGGTCDESSEIPELVEYDAARDAWSLLGQAYAASSPRTVWDGSGVVVEGGHDYLADPLGPPCLYGKRVWSGRRTRWDDAARAFETLPERSPVPSSTGARSFWTGTEVLVFNQEYALGAFYSSVRASGGADTDRDGWTACLDCDDGDPGIHPGAAETCGDGIDSDCNGVEWNDAGPDADGDGERRCGSFGDCDDGDPARFHGNPEICDGKDNDCDLYPDDGLETLDRDVDGYGCPADCDDGNPDVHPNAPEVCNGRDDDCDGSADEGIGTDADADGHRLCNGVGDCNDGNAGVWARPGDTEGLAVAGYGPTSVTWTNMKPAWGTSSVYDVAMGLLLQLRSAGTFGLAQCVGNNRSQNSYSDATPRPSAGDGRYYLVRGQNACGKGTWGSAIADDTLSACP